RDDLVTGVQTCALPISQALRDDAAVALPNIVSADRLVAMAKAYGASMVGTSYNEPLITAEWAVEVFKQARPAGFHTAFISNGNRSEERRVGQEWRTRGT